MLVCQGNRGHMGLVSLDYTIQSSVWQFVNPIAMETIYCLQLGKAIYSAASMGANNLRSLVKEWNRECLVLENEQE